GHIIPFIMDESLIYGGCSLCLFSYFYGPSGSFGTRRIMGGLSLCWSDNSQSLFMGMDSLITLFCSIHIYRFMTVLQMNRWPFRRSSGSLLVFCCSCPLSIWYSDYSS